MATDAGKWPDRIDTDEGTPWLGRLLAFLYNHWPWYRRRFQRALEVMRASV